MSMKVLRQARIERAAVLTIYEWDRWQNYLRELNIKQPENGIMPFASALGDLRRAIFNTEPTSEGKAA